MFNRRTKNTAPESKRSSQRRRPYPFFKPLLEALEERLQPTTFLVTNTGDSGSGTLRQAIMDANANKGPDVIDFNIITSTGGVQTIQPTSALPTITDPVTIDGYTQPGASANTGAATGDDAVLQIVLNGGKAGAGVNGLLIQAGNSTVRGLVINGFSGSGIALQIGAGNVVAGNFIGTDVTGTKAFANAARGVEIQQGVGNTIGGTSAADRNLISGNGQDGIGITVNALGNVVQGNFIGTQMDGTRALGNGANGVIFQGNSSNNTLGGTFGGAGNTIAFNTRNGVTVETGTGNAILSNAIFSNRGLGIDLGNDGVTPNHPGDTGTGANNLQNFPVVSLAQVQGAATTITGTLNGMPGQPYTIELFVNDKADASGFGQGQRPLGTTKVTTDPSTGNGSFTFGFDGSLSPTQFVTATATDSRNDTSEFSADRQVTLAQGSQLIALASAVCGAEGVPLNNVLVASFQDRGGSQTPGSYSATIDWGDGTPTSQGTVTSQGQGFAVTGSHSYGSEGNYNIHVAIMRADGATATALTPATIGGFVTQLYHDVMKRAPEITGLNFWLTQEHRGMTRTAIADYFWQSVEHVGLELADLYLEILHRNIDGGGMAFWEGQVAGGLDLTSVAIDLLTSREYLSTHVSNQAFVQGLFEDVYGRPADAAGLVFWQAILDNHLRQRDAVAFYFLSSIESFQLAIREYYATFLGRAIDGTALAALTAQANAGMATPLSLTSSVLGSEEYLARARALACQTTSMLPV